MIKNKMFSQKIFVFKFILQPLFRSAQYFYPDADPEAQKHTDPDPEHCLVDIKGFLTFFCLLKKDQLELRVLSIYHRLREIL
jgi:hypothetical protein